MTIKIESILALSPKEGSFQQELPEFYKLKTATENGSWHLEQNVFDNVVAVYEALEQLLAQPPLSEEYSQKVTTYLSQLIGSKTRGELLRIVTLLQDTAKPQTVTAEGERLFSLITKKKVLR